MNTVLAWAMALSAVGCPPGDAGTVVVIGEEPTPLQFSIPALSQYKFAYDPARISLWDTVTMDNLIPPGTIFIAPALAGDFEPDCDVDLKDFSEFQVCFTGSGGGPPAPGCDAFDFEPDTDVDLADFVVFESNISGPDCGTIPLTVFAEGLTASTSLCDVPVDVLTAPPGGGTFTLFDTAEVTVVSIDITPSSGPLGTEVSVTLDPAMAPIAFDSLSTAEWDGVFDPVAGPPSAPFTILYDAAQVHESSSASAVIVAGDGTTVNGPDSSTLDFPGTLDGVLTLNLDVSLARTFDFTPSVAPGVWESITYDDDSLSTGPPMLAGEPTDLEILLLSSDPDPTPDEVVLLQSYTFHLAAVMRVDENPTTVASAPGFIDVDLVTFTSGGVEVDRRENVRLDRVMGDDGDPDNLVYHSDLTKPIILVDVALDPGSYPNVVVLQAEVGGTANIVPELP